jgi:hypothetical protein
MHERTLEKLINIGLLHKSQMNKEASITSFWLLSNVINDLFDKSLSDEGMTMQSKIQNAIGMHIRIKVPGDLSTQVMWIYILSALIWIIEKFTWLQIQT